MTNIAWISLLVFVFSMGAMLILFVISAVQNVNGVSDESERTMDWAMVFMAVAFLSFFTFVSCTAFSGLIS